jgi:Lysozyme like domain
MAATDSPAGMVMTVAGAVLLWSGIKGKSVTTILKDILSGKNPDAAPETNTLSTSASASGSVSSGTNILGDIGSQFVPTSTSKSQLSFSQVENYWIMAGGPAAVAPIMAAISTAESGRDANAIQQGQPYATTGWGLWQITPGDSEPQIGTNEQLLNPLTNARAAVAKYNSQGLGAWTTYTSGIYERYLGGA